MIQHLYCKRCNNEVIIPDFTDNQKRELQEMKLAGLNVMAVHRIIEIAQLDLRNSKDLMLHINKIPGHCHRCAFQELAGEHVICPKCKSVNTNWDCR